MAGQEMARVSATIANGAAVTGWIESKGCIAVAVDIPSSWTSADLTFEISDDGTTSKGKVRDVSGEPVRAVVNASTPLGSYVVTPDVGWAIGAAAYFRVVSTNTASEANVNQAAERTLKVSLLK
jgi:hypothetical protein